MIRGRDINTVVNHYKSALGMQSFTGIDRMMSKVVDLRYLSHWYC